MREENLLSSSRGRRSSANCWIGAMVLLLHFLPSAVLGSENCTNGIDDDANALVDCMDLECIGTAACPFFFDDFESYPPGLNPGQLYQYYYNPLSWSGDTYDRGDLFVVDALGDNQVLRYYHPAPNVHFPATGKFLRKDFEDFERAGFTFYRTQHSPGFPSLVFAWQGPTSHCHVQVDYTNQMHIIKRDGGSLMSSITLWDDLHVLQMEAVRIEVEKQDDFLVATTTRLDTGESKSLWTEAPPSLAGRVGFWFYEDWYGPIYFHVDDFLVRGQAPSANQPPVAICIDVTVAAGESCHADASIDDGSFDPDGEAVLFSQDPPGPYALGSTQVTLLVEDGQLESDTCESTVMVEDRAASVIQCHSPETIVPPDAPISFTATAVDNCAVQDHFISTYDCFAFTHKGKRIDKTDSCIVEIDGATITIADSGGVGTHITWEVLAGDPSGNVSGQVCEVEVVNPGHGG